MSKILEVHLPDDVFAKLEQLSRISGCSSDHVAGIILRTSIEKMSQHQETVPETIDFESTLSYALQKNEELLRRLAK